MYPLPLRSSQSWTAHAHGPLSDLLRILLPILAALLILLASALPVSAQGTGVDTSNLPAEFRSREAQLVALVNVERAKAGLLPLRWNRELSDAASFLARDSTERATPACGVDDTLGRRTGERIRAFGYTNPTVYGEVVVCGFTEPAAAVNAWMYSDRWRPILLNPEAREAGAGYYFSPEKQRGFVAFNLSLDETFAPAIINGEAVSTPSRDVTLTIYPNREPLPPAVQMKISNEPNFAGVPWEAFATQKSWQLAEGSGWRTVYVLTRDAFGRTTLLTDTIMLGANAPKEEISLDHATNIGSALEISALPPTASGAIRLSFAWQLDSPLFTVFRGPSSTLTDPAAVGGTALLLAGDDREGLARAEATDLPLNRVLTAYARLKVSDNSGSDEVARLFVRADGHSFGPLVVKANDFASPGSYQEFAINFAFPVAPMTAIAEVEVVRTGGPDVTLDVVRFFGQPLPTDRPIVWSAGASYVRNRGVWGRAEAAGSEPQLFDVTFSPVDNARQLLGNDLQVAPSPQQVIFDADSQGAVQPLNAAMVVCGLWCDNLKWEASTNAPWLKMITSPEGLILSVDATGLAKGIYYAQITITPTQLTGADAPVSLPAPTTAEVELRVDGARPLTDSEIVTRVYLPMTQRP